MKEHSVRKLPALHANVALRWTGERAGARTPLTRARAHSVSLSFVNSQWELGENEPTVALKLIGLKVWAARSSEGEEANLRQTRPLPRKKPAGRTPG